MLKEIKRVNKWKDIQCPLIGRGPQIDVFICAIPIKTQVGFCQELIWKCRDPGQINKLAKEPNWMIPIS